MADRPMPVYGDDVFDWHTLEGACVVRRGDKYVCLYSGGRWDSELYGVDYGVADSVLGPYTEDAGPIHARITQTRLGRIIGPGHNSVVVGPDGETTYIVYHGWNEARTIRSPYVSRLDWDGWRPLPVNFSS
jgi:GH43 family beta-xylosidase